jgi:hypothetical protein
MLPLLKTLSKCIKLQENQHDSTVILFMLLWLKNIENTVNILKFNMLS